MEASFKDANEPYSDKIVETNTVTTVSTTTSYSETDTIGSYTEYVSHEQSSQILTNIDLNSYNTQEYTMETSVTNSESNPTEPVKNMSNDGDPKEITESEFQEKTIAEKNPIETTEVTDDSKSPFAGGEITEEYEEIQTQTEVPQDELLGNIVVEEPVEKTGGVVEQHVPEVSETIEEIASVPLPPVEDRETQAGNCFIIEPEESNNDNIVTLTTEVIPDTDDKNEMPMVSENEQTESNSQQENTEKSVQLDNSKEHDSEVDKDQSMDESMEGIY